MSEGLVDYLLMKKMLELPEGLRIIPDHVRPYNIFSFRITRESVAAIPHIDTNSRIAIESMKFIINTFCTHHANEYAFTEPVLVSSLDHLPNHLEVLIGIMPLENYEALSK